MTSVKELCNFRNICGDDLINHDVSIGGYSGAVIHNRVTSTVENMSVTHTFISL